MVRFVLASKKGHAPTHDDYRQIADMIGVKFREPKPELADTDNGFSPA